KSLVTRLHVEPDLRLSMFEVIREYGRGEAEARGELRELEAAHANYFLQFAEQAESELIGGDQLIWMQRLDEEHANVREALTRFADNGEIGKVGRLSAALWRFWITRGFLHEGLLWLETALAQAESLSDTTRARLLNGAGSLARDMGQYDR